MWKRKNNTRITRCRSGFGIEVTAAQAPTSVTSKIMKRKIYQKNITHSRISFGLTLNNVQLVPE